MPTRVEFGVGSIAKVGEEAKKLNMKNIMLVTDKGVMNAGISSAIEQVLIEANLHYMIYGDVVPNPRDIDIDAAGQLAIGHNIDGLIAIGGGSVIDTAKAVGALVTNEGKVLDLCGVFKLKKEILPLIAIPTTAGTGSETTAFAVVTNTKAHIKESIWDSKAMAKVAILDPELLLGLPDHIMASTGMDALTHAIEAYTGLSAIPFTDGCALQAIELISANLRNAVNKANVDNCSNMLIASCLAGVAIGAADVAAVHCMAEALGGRYDIPHGIANAMLLSTVSEYNADACVKKYSEVAQAMGVDISGMSTKEAAAESVKSMKQLSADIGIKQMKEFDIISPEDFPALAKAAYENTSTPSNPVKMTEKIYLNLFKKAYE